MATHFGALLPVKVTCPRRVRITIRRGHACSAFEPSTRSASVGMAPMHAVAHDRLTIARFSRGYFAQAVTEGHAKLLAVRRLQHDRPWTDRLDLALQITNFQRVTLV